MGEFDVIALWHCLEHLAEPWRMIENAAKHLAPGGILLIAIPNIESLEFRLLKARWVNLDAPRHVTFYPREALIRLCEAAGLVTLQATTNDKLSDQFSTLTWHTFASTLVPPVFYLRGGMTRLLKGWANRKERGQESGSGLTAVFQRQL
jgi:SAM-dependent methyltransferase